MPSSSKEEETTMSCHPLSQEWNFGDMAIDQLSELR